MNLRNVLAATVLAGAAAMTWYWSRQPPPAAVARPDGEIEQLGYWLRGARLFGADEAGQIIYTVTAERVEELPGEQRLELTGVTIEYRPETDISWLVSAARATGPKSGSYLELSGGVELANDRGDGSPRTVIKAPTLALSHDAYRVESPGPVEVMIGDDVLSAVGLVADLKTDDLRLESNGHGRFVP